MKSKIKRGAFRGKRSAAGKRFVLRPPTKRTALLSGTALASGILVAMASMVAMPKPAMADCAIINPSPTGPGDLGFYQIVCGGKIVSEIEYEDGAAPTLSSDTTFNFEVHLSTAAPIVPGTLILSPYDGIDIDSTNEDGYNIEVFVDNQTAIWAQTEIIQTRTMGEGTIAITNNGFLSNQDHNFGPQAGIYASTEDGDITITNNGDIGVVFIDGLDFVGGNFVDSTDGNAVVALTNGSAFNLPDVATDGVSGDGIYATTAGGNVIINNNGSVWAAGDAIAVENNGGGTTTITTNGLASLHSGEHGINATNNGGVLTIYNGDGLGDNPDGLIDADWSGIRARNFNGGNIVVYNGFLSGENPNSSNSQIYARGDYGIDARSRSNGDGQGFVDVFNYGLVQLEGEDGIAAVRARTSGDIHGYAAFFNGGIDLDGLFANNARVNAYLLDTDTEGGLVYQSYDADGVHLIKNGGAGGHLSMDHPLFSEGYNPFHLGVLGTNYGVWDFTRQDHYLTPGFQGPDDDTPVGPQVGTFGGIYAPTGSALVIRHFGADNSAFLNYGTLIGQGNRWDPVLDIETVSFGEGNEEEEAYGNMIFVYNAFGALMGSANTPHAWSMSLDDQLVGGFGYFESLFGGVGPEYGLADPQSYLNRSVMVDWDHVFANIGDDLGQLGSFADAANDRLLQTNWGSGTWPSQDGGAPAFLFNEGLLIGQIRLNSEGDFYEDEEQDGVAGISDVNNLFVNTGAWFTHGTSRFFGGGGDALINLGLVQTGFDADAEETTRFHGLNNLVNYGVLSMIDTMPGSDDDIYFDLLTTTGDYWAGGLNGSYPSYGYLGVDTFFGQDGGDNVGSDRFVVEGEAYGSTGIIVNKLNTTPGGINTAGILVATVEGGIDDEDEKCGDGALCKEGNTFFISDQSRDYQNIDGYGTVRDGMFAWYLQERPIGEEDPEYFFVSDWGPEAYHQPGLITAAQNAWYASGGVVEDHIYGNVFPQTGLGGGGADLTYYPPVAGPAPAQAYATGYRSAIWGRATGNWANRDTEVDANGLTFDTGFNQDTYSLLGGLEFRPTGESNLRLGVFGGYLTSKVSFDSYAATATLSGGTVGAYAALTSGAFYVDAEVKGDFLSIDYETPFVDVTTKATSVGVLANVGYRMQSGPSFFEPIASFSFVNTALDDTSGGGASVAYSNGRSVRAGAGARIGTSFGAPGGPQTEVDLLAKVWNEFAGPNEVTLSDGMGSSETFTDGISGVFGEVVGRATMYSADRRTSAFVSAGAEFGKNWTTYSAKAGVRRAF